MPASTLSVPLATPDQEARIAPCLGEIAEALWARREDLDPSLYSGLAGAALFLGHLSRHPGFEVQAGRARELLERAVARVEEVATPQLYHGFPGLAWCVEHLRAFSIVEGDDPNADVDELLLECLDATHWDGPYDLMDGLVGLGIYALERPPVPAAEAMLLRILRHLEELALPYGVGLLWLTPPEQVPEWQRGACPEGYLNFGLAHGIPGVLGLLAAIHARGLEPDRCARLLAGGLAGLGTFLQPKESGALLPAWCPWGLPRPASTSSRVAWCNGDFGASLALWRAARPCGDAPWAGRARAMALLAAARPAAESGIQDAGLCHGSAGNLHLFHRWFQATGDPVFRGAARGYLDATLAYRDPARGIAGWWSRATASEAHPSDSDPAPGLLEGAAGVGLALLSCLPGADPSWDRILIPA